MNMPIKVTYYKKKTCANYIVEEFNTYEEFGKWYLDNRMDIGIFSINELGTAPPKKEEPPKIQIGNMEFDSFW